MKNMTQTDACPVVFHYLVLWCQIATVLTPRMGMLWTQNLISRLFCPRLWARPPRPGCDESTRSPAHCNAGILGGCYNIPIGNNPPFCLFGGSVTVPMSLSTDFCKSIYPALGGNTGYKDRQRSHSYTYIWPGPPSLDTPPGNRI